MLRENDQSAVQAFQQAILQLDRQISSSDFAALKSELQALQKFFQEEIRPIDIETIPPESVHRVQSLLVEIDKQMRLVGMDAMFLQTARQAETVQQRSSQMRDRLKLLTNYCTALLTD